MRQRLETCLRVRASTFENTFFDRSEFAGHTTEVSSGCDLKSVKRYASCNSRALFISNLTSLVSLCIFRQEGKFNKNSIGDKKCNPSKRIVGASAYIISCYHIFNFSRIALLNCKITSVIVDYVVGIIY